jgi:hypothetical protein
MRSMKTTSTIRSRDEQRPRKTRVLDADSLRQVQGGTEIDSGSGGFKGGDIQKGNG